MRFDGELTSELRRRQLAAGETDQQFADRLGIERETWRRMRTGKQSATLRILRKVAQVFPDLVEQARLVIAPDDANQCDSEGE